MPDGGGAAGDNAAEPGFGGNPALPGVPPAFGVPTTEAGAFVVGGPLGRPAPAGAPGGVAEGGVPGCSGDGVAVFALGLTVGATAAPAGGAGGAPLAPGTGSVFALGSGWTCGATAGALAGSAFGAAPPWPAGSPAAPGLMAAGLIDALGGTGALPCWISVARCATDGGSAGVAAPGAATGITPVPPLALI